MEKNKTHIFGKKSIILAAVSLVLVIITAIGATTSWIEEVSQVEFSSTDGQQTPLHVGQKALKAEAVMKNNPTPQVVELSQYFYESGDMHLSPCYSDGEKFYFPVQGITADDEEEEISFREGTKDDANVNYFSATFKIKSEGANTAYWFEKSTGVADYIAFKKDKNTTNNTALHDYLRCSVTIDGVTNVYALNSTGKFHTLASSSATSATEKDGRRMDQYSYYTETFNNNSPEGYYKNQSANVTNKPNQGAGSNLNGNTLFNVPQYNGTEKTGIKTVTVKIWLEYDPSLSTCGFVDVASVNMNLVSSWAKTRRIYVKDATVHQDGYTNAKWLSNASAKLYFALKNDLDQRWELKRYSNSDYYYIDTDTRNNLDDDLPAVYNNMEVVLLRCGPSGPGSNSNNQHAYTNNGKTVYCWDKWETTFPDNYHSEVYTVYSTDFATWESSDKVSTIYFINSQRFSNASDSDASVNGKNFKNVYDYMWDNSSVYNSSDINGKVVKNANWPGVKMTTLLDASISSPSLELYAFFFNSDYDRIIFSDGDTVSGKNYEFQTPDLTLSRSYNNKTFDMATMTWFDTIPGNSNWSSRIPTYSGDTTFIYGNFVTDDKWRRYRLAYGGQYGSTSGNAFNNTSASNMLSKIYVKTSGTSDYQFMVFYNNQTYKTWDDNGNLNLYAGGSVKMYPEGGNNDSNVICKNLTKGVYRIYLKPISNNGIEVFLSSGAAD